MSNSSVLQDLLFITFIDGLKLGMAYVFCDELQSAPPSKFQPPLLGMFYTRSFQILDYDSRDLGLNMFFTIVVVVAQ